MKDKPGKNRPVYLFLLFVCAYVVVLPNAFSSSVYGQRTDAYVVQGELTLDYILEKLRSTKQPNQKIKNQAILAYIKKSKDTIQFVMTDEEEAKMRDAGADDAFISYIAKVSQEMMKTSVGNFMLGNKYLDVAQSNFKLKKEKAQAAWNSQYVKKNEEEAKEFDAESAKFDQIAQENANTSIPYFNQVKMLEEGSTMKYTPVAYSSLAIAYNILKDFDKSLNYATLAIEAEPNSVRYFNRANLYDAKARVMQSPSEIDAKRAIHELAIKDCEMALSLDSTMGPCRQLIKGIKEMWHMP